MLATPLVVLQLTISWCLWGETLFHMEDALTVNQSQHNPTPKPDFNKGWLTFRSLKSSRRQQYDTSNIKRLR